MTKLINISFVGHKIPYWVTESWTGYTCLCVHENKHSEWNNKQVIPVGGLQLIFMEGIWDNTKDQIVNKSTCSVMQWIEHELRGQIDLKSPVISWNWSSVSSFINHSLLCLPSRIFWHFRAKQSNFSNNFKDTGNHKAQTKQGEAWELLTLTSHPPHSRPRLTYESLSEVYNLHHLEQWETQLTSHFPRSHDL